MSKFEDQFAVFLRQHHISFEKEKTFPDLKHGYYRFDFYLPTHNILIEIDGLQHYKYLKIFYHSRKDFLNAQERDRQKNRYCLAHDIPLYRIPFWELNNIHIISDLFKDDYLVKTIYHNDKIKVPKEFDNYLKK